jgi:hypothetical protein
MSTTMTELDRQAAVAVFRASLPRRGAKGRNDRLFLKALHHHLVSAAEALRQMERRFERLSKAAVFEMFFDRLASFSSSAHLVQMFDSTVIRAHVSPIFHSAIY